MAMKNGGSRWPYENTVILINWCIFGFVALDRLLIANLFPWILPDLKLSFTQAGLIMSVLALTWAFGSMIFGGISDRVGRRVIILPATIVFSVLSWVTGFATGIASLLGIRSVMGLAEGAFFPAAIATVAEESTPSRRGLNIGIFESAFALVGLLICPLYATAAAAAWGWRWAIYLTVIPGLILAAIFGKFVREPASTAALIKARKEGRAVATKGHAGESVGWAHILGYRNVIVSCLTAIFVMGWFFLFVSFGMLFLTKVRGFAPGTAGVIMSMWGVGGVLGYLVLTSLSDHFGRKPAVVLGGVLTALSAYMFAYGATSQAGLMFWIFLMGLFGLGLFALSNGVLPFESVPTSLAGSASGLVVFVGEFVGSAFLPALGGIVADKFGLQITMAACATCCVLVAICGAALRETAPRVLARRQQAAKAAAAHG
jgi:MFS family permease